MRIVTYLLGGAMLFTAIANAMPIPQYDKMSRDDRSTYVTLLIKGAVEGLKAHHEDQQAEKLLDLFLAKGDTGEAAQFEKNLQAARIINKKNAADLHYEKPPYEVEHALALTLKDNGIVVPVSFLLSINKDFKPSAITTPHK